MSLKSSLFNVWRTPQRNPDIPKSYKFITVKSVRANVGAYERFRWTCIEVFPQNQFTLFLHSLTASHFSRAWNWFQVITKHLVIPALFTAYMLFPRFLPLTCFSRARHQISRLKPVTRSACSGVITISNDIKHKWVFSSSPSQTIPSKSLIQSFHKKIFFCSLLDVSVSYPVFEVQNNPLHVRIRHSIHTTLLKPHRTWTISLSGMLQGKNRHSWSVIYPYIQCNFQLSVIKPNKSNPNDHSE